MAAWSPPLSHLVDVSTSAARRAEIVGEVANQSRRRRRRRPSTSVSEEMWFRVAPIDLVRLCHPKSDFGLAGR